MKQHHSTSKRLVKNTAFMYGRMAFLMLVSLYTSRVILRQLGVDDFGIYNVVGSVVAIFVSLKSIFAGATQRFLNYEMGSGHPENLHTVFNTSVTTNLLIGLLFVLLVEIVGVWFLETQINVAPDRLLAAKWVFQFSVLTTFIQILNIPLDACIIAHERLDFYAYVSIFEGLAKLGICYLLSLWVVDKLILYGFLMMIVTIGVTSINLYFCRSQFSECYITWNFDKKYFKNMTTFAGWAFFGNTSQALAQSGLNMVLNVFGGPVVNAARGITYQVTGALQQLTNNITVVVKPYVVKTYANGEFDKLMGFSFLSSKIYFTIQMILVIIISFLTNRILQLWLGQVPDYTVLFLNLVLAQSLVKSLHIPIDMIFSAKGDIKYYELAEGLILLLPVPVSYCLLSIGFPYYSAFVSLVVVEVIHIYVITLICRKVCNFPLKNYYKSVILPCVTCVIVYAFMFWYNHSLGDVLLHSILNIMITFIITLSLMFFLGLNKYERNILKSILKINNHGNN